MQAHVVVTFRTCPFPVNLRPNIPTFGWRVIRSESAAVPINVVEPNQQNTYHRAIACPEQGSDYWRVSVIALKSKIVWCACCRRSMPRFP
jgi:hypothetical protein